MARTPNKVKIQIKASSEEYEMTQRQAALFMYLSDRIGQEVPIPQLLRDLGVSIHNLRVTKMQVQRIVLGFYTINSRWGKSYTMLKVG